VTAQLNVSYAGLTRVSILLTRGHSDTLSYTMDCRVKPGNDKIDNDEG
jgi:hypothetical protein